MCEDLKSIILLVTEHRHIEIYNVFISDYYKLVVSAPKMIGLCLVLKSCLVQIFNSIPNWNFFPDIFFLTFTWFNTYIPLQYFFQKPNPSPCYLYILLTVGRCRIFCLVPAWNPTL